MSKKIISKTVWRIITVKQLFIKEVANTQTFLREDNLFERIGLLVSPYPLIFQS
jgi:hypothetical protein